MVEQRIENPRVVGSIPTPATTPAHWPLLSYIANAETAVASMQTDVHHGSDSLPRAFSAVASGASRALVIKVVQPDTAGDIVKRVIDLGKNQGCTPKLIHVDEIDHFFATSAPVIRSSDIVRKGFLGQRILLLIDGVMSASETTKDKLFRFLFRGDSLNYITIIVVGDPGSITSQNSLKIDFPLSTIWFSQHTN